MKTYDELTNDILEKTRSEKARRRRIKRRICAGVTAFTLVLGGVLAAHFVNRTPSYPILPTLDLPNRVISDNASDSLGQVLSTKKDYSSIYDCLITRDYAGAAQDGELRGDLYLKEDAAYNAKPTLPSAAADETEAVNSPEYSETNIQVDGVLESDMVKTDGKYIYAVSHENVYIYSAKDGEMDLVSKIPYLSEDNSLVSKNGGGDKKLYMNYRTPELYIAEGRLILIVQTTDINTMSDSDEYALYDSIYNTSGHDYLCAMVFDISALDAPTLLSAVAVSGYSVSTRMTDGKLYLVASDLYFYSSTIDEDNPASYIPKSVINGQTYLVGKDSIFCGKDKVECEYLNVLEIDVRSAEATSSLSLLGYNGEIMYQSKNNIYVSRTDYRENIESETAEDGTKTEKRTDTRITTITKISFAEGLSLEASAEVEGYLEDSFSMDEYNGYLRVVLSVNRGSNMYIVRDPSDGYGEYVNDSYRTEMSNSLYVLDSALNIVGSVTGLAPDERIYSCRFEGDDGYFVTYRETDPLFHVDLSDPANPVVIGELKIPGYSEYLQRFGEHLFGFGRTDDGMLKLSMFSENEDGTMTELATTVIEGAYYSAALYDHHAIMADSERNLITFATAIDDRSGLSKSVYYIISYGDSVFTVEAVIDLTTETYALDNNLRGLYIGDFFYIYQNNPEKSAIASYDLSGFAPVDEEIMDKYNDHYNSYYPFRIVD